MARRSMALPVLKPTENKVFMSTHTVYEESPSDRRCVLGPGVCYLMMCDRDGCWWEKD